MATGTTIGGIIIIFILIFIWVVLIINTNNYNRVRRNAPLSITTANTLFWINLIITIFMTFIFVYIIYVVYKDINPSHVNELKLQTVRYIQPQGVELTTLK